MVQQAVIEFTCDNCGATADLGEDKDKELPFHWVEVQYRLHYGTLEKVDLCDDCREVFEKALEQRRGKNSEV
jgi:hypothetical protein